MEEIAKERSIPLKMIEDLVFPDIKNEKILVLTWRIILEPNGVCPFYSSDNGCTINDQKPLACRAYPLAIKRVDAFSMRIDIDPLCTFTELNRTKLERIDYENLKAIYPDEFLWATKMLNRNRRAIMQIRQLTFKKEIEIPRLIDPKEYDRMLRDWERVILYDDEEGEIE